MHRGTRSTTRVGVWTPGVSRRSSPVSLTRGQTLRVPTDRRPTTRSFSRSFLTRRSFRGETGDGPGHEGFPKILCVVHGRLWSFDPILLSQSSRNILDLLFSRSSSIPVLPQDQRVPNLLHLGKSCPRHRQDETRLGRRSCHGSYVVLGLIMTKGLTERRTPPPDDSTGVGPRHRK